MGGEFQAHRLDIEDCKFLAEQYSQDFGDFERDYLGGGDDFSSVLFSGVYGPYVNDLSLKSDTKNEIFNPQDFNFSEDGSFCDDQLASPNCVDYFYLTSGKVYGHIEIVGLEIANFDINRLIFKFSKIELNGYAEKYAQIIHSIEYDHYECELITEDRGQEIYRHLTGYEFVDGEFQDYLIIHDTDTSQDKFNFSLIQKIFSQQ